MRLLFTFLILCSSLTAYGGDDKIFDYPSENIELGLGWNNLAESSTFEQCIDFVEYKNEEKPQTGTSVTNSYSSTNEYLDHTNLSVSAKVKSILGKSSAGVTANYLTDKRIEIGSKSFLGVVSVINSEKSISKDIVIKEKYKKLAEEGIQKFIEKCGDSYVSSIINGGKLIVNFEVNNLNMTEFNSTKIQLNNSLVNIEMNGEKVDEQTRKRIEDNTRIEFFHEGGNSVAIPATFEAIQNVIFGFPGKVAHDSKNMQIRTKKYDLKELSGENPNSKNIDLLVKLYFDINDSYKSFDDAATNKSLYLDLSYNEDLINARRDALIETRKIVLDNLKECYESKKCDISNELKGADPFLLLQAELPIKIRNLTKTSEMNILVKNQSEKSLELSKLKCTLMNQGDGGVTVPSPVHTHITNTCNNPDYNKKKNEIDLITNQIIALNSNFINDVKESIYEYRVGSLIKDRCLLSITNTNYSCSKSDEIQELKNYIDSRININLLDTECESLESRYSNLSDSISNETSEEARIADEQQLQFIRFEAMGLAKNNFPGCAFHFGYDKNGNYGLVEKISPMLTLGGGYIYTP